MTRPIRRFAAAALVVAVGASCNVAQLPSGSPPQPSICAGIPADLGGCAADRHTFTGGSCVELAAEWAGVLDKAVIAILDGPAAVNGDARSSRLRQVLVVVTSDMNTRLRALGLADECDAPQFMATAEPLFTARLREGVGAALFDGDPVLTYQDWLDDVGKVLGVIDDGESPAPSTSVASPPRA